MDDAYLRLHASNPPLAGSVPAYPGSMVFIDIEPSSANSSREDIVGVMKRIAHAPPGFFLQASYVLIRWPSIDEGADTLAGGLSRVRLPMRTRPRLKEYLQWQAVSIRELISTRAPRGVHVGIVIFPLSQSPSIVWADNKHRDQPDRMLLARARRAELRTLLEKGNGIWQPSGYHYCLPSGEHSSTFVRLADAFRSPRDPVALATWLHQEIKNGLAIVSDTPTLLPLISAIELAASRSGLSSPQSVMLSDYTSNHFEVEHAVSRIAGAGHILGVVSVSSTGTTARRISDALDHSQLSFALETLVSRGVPAADEFAGPEVKVRHPWHGVPDKGEVFANADVCRLCRREDAAPVVTIDPNGFQPLVLPHPRLITPAIIKAHKCQELWQYYDRTMGAGINAQPHPTTSEFRSGRASLAVRCYPHWLLDESRYEDWPGVDVTGKEMYDDFLKKTEERVGSIAVKMSRREDSSDSEDAFSPNEIDVIVTTSTDHNSTGFDNFLKAVCQGFGLNSIPPIVAVDQPHTQMEGHIDQLKDKSNVLVLSLGSITGTTMQKLLLAVHTILPELGNERNPLIAGLVMHARMEEYREWKVLENAYTRLFAIWTIPLSLMSPFDDEAELLNIFPPDHSDELASKFYEDRRTFLNGLDPVWESRIGEDGADVDPWAVFWGMHLNRSDGNTPWPGKDAPRLRPGSRYGNRLRACSTFAAVGSAVQTARLDNRSTQSPEHLLFEMPAILRSYFDAPIIASILRWVEPHETWWGSRHGDASNVLAEAFARADPVDKRLLLPEFLLASAQGKIPKNGIDWLEAQAIHHIWCWENSEIVNDGDISWSDAEIAPVKLGLALLRKESFDSQDHFTAAKQRLEDAANLLDGWQADQTSQQSLATARLKWALESFLESGGNSAPQ
ncbi:MAG: hypothetical protein F4213_16100 [Boseongicola sp. SB0677_bin_26]|nr:hypothetical protein [Boseongicola sp. SB0677_bin_26]